MHIQLLCFFLLLVNGALAADTTSLFTDSAAAPNAPDTKTSSTSNGRVKVTNIQTTELLPSKEEAISSASPSLSQNAADNSIMKFLLTIPTDDSYYNAVVTAQGSPYQVRVDVVQPDVWLMNGANIQDCDDYITWESLQTELELPLSYTEDSTAFNGQICGYGGLYTTPVQTLDGTATYAQAEPTKANIYNGEHFLIPYPNLVTARGEFATDNLSFVDTSNEEVELDDFTFLLVNDTNVYYGGLGLAGNPVGLGFLDTLKQLKLINSSSYSLFFDLENAGELLPGMVDTRFLLGDFYQFDILPYTGLISNSAIKLPILSLDDVSIENKDGKLVLLSLTSGPLPVLLDLRSFFSYLPLNMVVNLALQTNAYFSSDAERWIVECDVITNSSANIMFSFGDLKIKVPLTEFMYPSSDLNDSLTFSNGANACFLNVMPDSSVGFSSLGLPFMTQIYLAVDNDGSKIALANTNRDLLVKPEDYLYSQSPTDLNTKSHTLGPGISSKVDNSIAYIQSGNIPFATSGNLSTTATLSRSVASSPDSIPARFSATLVNSGEVFSAKFLTFESVLPGGASAAQESTPLRAAGSKVRAFGGVLRTDGLSAQIWASIGLFLGGFVSIMML